MLHSSLKISKILTLVLTLAIFMVGCATSQEIQVVQADDNALTKEQLLAEIKKLDGLEKNINAQESKKGITGTNIAATLLFGSGLMGPSMDANEAKHFVEHRRSHLTHLYNQKQAKEVGKSSQGQRRSL